MAPLEPAGKDSPMEYRVAYYVGPFPPLAYVGHGKTEALADEDAIRQALADGWKRVDLAEDSPMVTRSVVASR